MYWLNGIKSKTLPITDRSIQYGDGVFTTMKVDQQEIRLWALHLERLKNAVCRLKIVAPDWLKLEKELKEVATSLVNGGVKIQISRGSGGRGYASKECHNTQVIMSTFAYPEHYLGWQEKGIELTVCETRLGLNPLLAGIKHTNRLEQILIKQELENTSFADGVVLDLNQKVIETSVGNLFWVKGEQLYTADLSLSGVEGVMKSHIHQLADKHHITIESIKTDIHALFMADEVFITNSLFEIVPINAIDGQTYTHHQLTHRFMENLYSC